MAGDPLDDHPKKKPSPKVFDCPSCGASIPLRALGLTVNVACPSCGSIIDVANENLRILQTAEQRQRIKPLIPLGRRGKLFGDTWEVIGFMERKDRASDFRWREYLLFNPYKGFRWLTESDGHWNFVRTTRERPVSKIGSGPVFRGTPYKLFHKGVAEVTYVIGEFYWRVKVDEAVDVADYIDPPLMLSSEQNEQEINWSVGEYLEPSAVQKAFRVEKGMPPRRGIAANQPSPMAGQVPAVLKLAGIFFLLVLVLQFATALTSRNQVVYRTTGVYDPLDRQKTKVTPSFELAGGMANLGISLTSPVSNSWLSLEGSLVNDTTGAEYGFEEGVEFYSGQDSDGYWSEGSQRTLRVLSLIPAGRYHLVYELTGAPEIRGPQEYGFAIRRGVVTWSNFWWALALLGIFPGVVGWRSHRFEVARWSESDFSPYASDDDDD